jgi:hypothetical protein
MKTPMDPACLARSRVWPGGTRSEVGPSQQGARVGGSCNWRVPVVLPPCSPSASRDIGDRTARMTSAAQLAVAVEDAPN